MHRAIMGYLFPVQKIKLMHWFKEVMGQCDLLNSFCTGKPEELCPVICSSNPSFLFQLSVFATVAGKREMLWCSGSCL